MNKRILLVLLAFLLTSCNAPNGVPAQTPTATESTSALARVTDTPLPTSTFTPTEPPAPTHTPAPTGTSLPSLTPTLALPVSLRTPLPALSQAISADNSGSLRLLGTYSGDPYGVTLLSANGKRAFFANRQGIDVFDLEAQSLIRHLEVNYRVNRFDFTRGSLSTSADGSILGVVAKQDIEILNSEGKLLYSLPDRLNEDYPSLVLMDGVGISPDGKLAAMVECQAGEYSGCPFRVVRTDRGEVAYTWDQKMLSLHGSAPVFSPDGSMLTTWFDNRLWFWSTADWSAVSNLPLNDDQEWAFSPDSQQIAIGMGKIQLWDIMERKLVREFQTESVNVVYPLFSPDGSSVAGVSWQGQAAVWNTTDGALSEETQLESRAFSRMRLVNGKIEIVPLPGHDPNLWGQSAGRNGFQFVDRDGQPTLVFAQGDQGCALSIDGQAQCQSADYMMLGSDRQLYYGSTQDKTVEFHSEKGAKDGAVSLTWSGYALEPYGIDPQNHFLFYSLWSGPNNANSMVRDTEKGKTIQEWKNAWMSPISYSVDGQYAAFILNHNPRYEVVLFDLVNRRAVYQKTYSYGYAPVGVAFSPDSQMMALTVGDAQNQSLVIETVEVAAPHNSARLGLDLPEGVVPHARVYSPDGTLLAIGLSDGGILLVRTSDNSLVSEWPAHQEGISELAFSPDGGVLASLDEAGYIKFWGIWP